MNYEKKIKTLKSCAALVSVLTSIILCIIKAVAVYFTSSLSILSSTIDSLTDVLSSMVTFIAIKYSNKPLNSMHRYGYGKAESVSALLQAIFIASSGAFIFYDGIKRFITPVVIKQTNIGIIIMFISLLFTCTLIILQNYVIRQTNSEAIKADRAHYFVDLLTNISILISLSIVHYYNLYWLDILIAVIIAVYLIFNALKIAYDALSEITDKEVDNDVKIKIINIINNEPVVKGFHDFRTRVSGIRMFIEVHLEFDGELSLLKIHSVSEHIENQIISLFPTAQILIHQDPYGIKENRLDHEISGKCDI